MYTYRLTQAHPWHGIEIGEKCPEVVNVFIEMLPSDDMKYEIDKESGHMILDRPQQYSNQCPALYGFVPQTLCLDSVAEYAKSQSNKQETVVGDNDPLDICVLSERPIQHSGLVLQARPIGGFRMFDKGEADDKIIAVLVKDSAYGHCNDITDVPIAIINRLKHYFLTYKQSPDLPEPVCEISEVYGKSVAFEVIRRSIADYNTYFQNQIK